MRGHDYGFARVKRALAMERDRRAQWRSVWPYTLLAVGCCLSGPRAPARGEPQAPPVPNPPAAGQPPRSSVLTNPDYFEKLKKEAEEQRVQQRKAQQAA